MATSRICYGLCFSITLLMSIVSANFGCKPARQYPKSIKTDTLKVFYAVAHKMDSSTICLQKNTQILLFIPQFSSNKAKFNEATEKFNHYLVSIAFPTEWFKLNRGLKFKQKKSTLRAAAQAFAETNSGFPLVYNFGIDSLFLINEGIVSLKMTLLFNPCGTAKPVLDDYYIVADLSNGKIYQPDSVVAKLVFQSIKNGNYLSTTFPKRHLDALKKLDLLAFSKRVQIFVTDSVYAWINPPHGKFDKKGKFTLPKAIGQLYLGKTVFSIIVNYYKQRDKKQRQDDAKKSMYSAVSKPFSMPAG